MTGDAILRRCSHFHYHTAKNLSFPLQCPTCLKLFFPPPSLPPTQSSQQPLLNSLCSGVAAYGQFYFYLYLYRVLSRPTYSIDLSITRPRALLQHQLCRSMMSAPACASNVAAAASGGSCEDPVIYFGSKQALFSTDQGELQIRMEDGKVNHG